MFTVDVKNNNTTTTTIVIQGHQVHFVAFVLFLIVDVYRGRKTTNPPFFGGGQFLKNRTPGALFGRVLTLLHSERPKLH